MAGTHLVCCCWLEICKSHKDFCIFPLLTMVAIILFFVFACNNRGFSFFLREETPQGSSLNINIIVGLRRSFFG